MEIKFRVVRVERGEVTRDENAKMYGAVVLRPIAMFAAKPGDPTPAMLPHEFQQNDIRLVGEAPAATSMPEPGTEVVLTMSW